MTTGRFRALAPLASVVLVLLGGCTSPGPIATHRNNVGMLKASVSQLEYDNQNLKKQVASLRTDSNRYETDLAREKEVNGELTARLDDAKDSIRRAGGDVTALNSSSDTSRASTAGTRDGDEIPAPARSNPSRRSRSSRKPPAAAIPQSRTTPVPGDIRSYDSVDPGPQASATDLDDGRWLPVARGSRGLTRSVVVR